MNPHDVIYIAIVLGDSSRANLKAHIPPLHPETYCHHVTLSYRPQSIGYPIGDRVSMQVIGVAQDDYGQAAVVETDLRSDNHVPHVTVSCQPGFPPAYSKDLLARGFNRIDPFPIKGVIMAYTDEGWIDQAL